MPLTPLTTRSCFQENPKLAKAANNLSTLITAIGGKSIPMAQARKINEITSNINKFQGTDSELIKQITSAQAAIIKLLEQELQLVPQNHYQLQWLILGMAAFGIPLGIAFGIALGNLAFLGIGLPIGMGLGIAVGTLKDKKALEEGRQLDWVAK
jgi:hypothetical protein